MIWPSENLASGVSSESRFLESDRVVRNHLLSRLCGRNFYLLDPLGLSDPFNARYSAKALAEPGARSICSMSSVDETFSRIAFCVSSSDIAINWYSLSRDAIEVHRVLHCWLHTARILSSSMFSNSSST